MSKFVSFCFPAYVLMAVIWCILHKFAMKNRFINMDRFYLVQFHRFFLDLCNLHQVQQGYRPFLYCSRSDSFVLISVVM